MKKILITVATTEFDELLQVIDDLQFVRLLKGEGYQHIVLQIGRGIYRFKNLFTSQNESEYDVEEHGLSFHIMRFHPNLVEVIQQVDLVIGHAGAGTILDVITCQKPMVVVNNPTLQNNHQLELANAIKASPQCEVAYEPSQVFIAFSALHAKLEPSLGQHDESSKMTCIFPIMQPKLFASLIEEMYGDVKSD